jgi:RNA polymerase sigma factor (sigma-70 family)
MRKFYPDFNDVFGKVSKQPIDPNDATGDLFSGIVTFYRFYFKEAISKPCEQAFKHFEKTEREKKAASELALLVESEITEADIYLKEDFGSWPSFMRKSIEPDVGKPYKTTIDLIIDGEQETFNSLYEKEFPAVVRHVLSNSGTYDEARDLFQDALVVLVEIAKDKRLTINKHGIEKYLFEIARRLWYNQLRRKKATKELNDNTLVIGGMEVEIEFYTEPDKYGDILIEIDKLGSRCKELLYHFYYLNRDWKTITEELGYISEGSARNQKYKCLEKIRKNLNNKS